MFLDDLFKVLKLNPTPKWRQLFDKYLSDLPSYYVGVNNVYNILYHISEARVPFG